MCILWNLSWQYTEITHFLWLNYLFDIPSFPRLVFSLIRNRFEISFHVISIIRSINIILTTKDINNNLAKFVVNALLVKRLRLLLNRNWLVPNILNDKNIKYLTRNLFIISTENKLLKASSQYTHESLLVQYK